MRGGRLIRKSNFCILCKAKITQGVGFIVLGTPFSTLSFNVFVVAYFSTPGYTIQEFPGFSRRRGEKISIPILFLKDHMGSALRGKHIY